MVNHGITGFSGVKELLERVLENSESQRMRCLGMVYQGGEGFENETIQEVVLWDCILALVGELKSKPN